MNGMPPIFSRGSSPRVRGSQSSRRRDKDGAGIIPAGAGLTQPCHSALTIMRDHPRGCGAHVYARVMDVIISGSSPRVRGSPNTTKDMNALVGIIPAGAGLTTRYALP